MPQRNPAESDAQVDGVDNVTATDMAEEKEMEDSFVNIMAMEDTVVTNCDTPIFIASI